MIRLLLAVILLFVALPAYAQCPPNPPPTNNNNKAGLIATINSCFADNTMGAITPAITRGMLTQMVNSWQQDPGVGLFTGLSYTLNAIDYGQLITFTNPGAITFNLPQPVYPVAFAPFSFFTQNVGTGTVTMIPVSSTICGVATKMLPPGWGAYVVSDGINWECLGPFNVYATQEIALGTVALGTTAVASGACAAPVVGSATAILSTDVVTFSFNSDPGFIAGYSSLTVSAYPVPATGPGFRVCNPSAGSVTPTAATLNWRVTR